MSQGVGPQRPLMPQIIMPDRRAAFLMALQEVNRPISEHVKCIDQQDCIEAYGVKISGQLLRALSQPSPKGLWFRIAETKDGVSRLEHAVMETAADKNHDPS